MNLEQAVAIFDEKNTAGEILNRKTGEKTTITKGQRAAILSSVKNGLRRAGVRESDLYTTDLTALAATLPDHARLDAEERGLHSKHVEADRVRRFLAVVEGKKYRRNRQSPDVALPQWRPAYQAVKKWEAEQDTRYIRAHRIIVLQNLASKHGKILTPHALPDRRTIEEWARAEGLPSGAVYGMFAAYAKAQDLLEASGGKELPDLGYAVSPAERGLRALPGIAELLVRAGSTKPVPEVTTEEIIALLAPTMHAALRLYTAQGENQNHSPGWFRKQTNAVSRLLAEAHRAGYDIATLEPIDLWLKEETVETQEKGRACRLSLGARLHPQSGAFGRRVIRIPLIRILCDRQAVPSAESSPIRLVRSEGAGEIVGIPFYTETIQMDLKSLFALTKAAYAEEWNDHPETWLQVKTVYDVTLGAMREVNQKRQFAGQKDKLGLLKQVTLPILVCIGLPALRSYVRTLREAFHASLIRNGSFHSPAVRRAECRYHYWLTRYLVAAVHLSDGLRVKNYTGARVGKGMHIQPTVIRDENGKWTGFSEVSTHFRGFDCPSVCLKIRTDKNGKERSRSHKLHPGIVDLELLFEYWTEARPKALVEAGLLDCIEAYDPDRDLDEWHFALFVSPQARPTKPHGNYGEKTVSDFVGQVIYTIARHVLGRELPDWEEIDRDSEFRSLFAAHVTRLLLGSYWGGIRDDWKYASVLTEDSENVLRDHYSEYQMVMEEWKDSPVVWMRPNYFDSLMNRVRSREAVNWDKETKKLRTDTTINWRLGDL